MRDFHPLRLSEVRPEIEGAATSLIFEVPQALQATFQWQAGQHLTLRFMIDGVEERRSYTISNPPWAPLRITVKQVYKGKVSHHVAGLAPGDTVEVMPPFGSFCLTPQPMGRRTHYFFGAGSGITPLFAMINAVLEEEPYSVAHLIYGNADEPSILLREELEALQDRHGNRFTLRHVISSPSMWSWFSPWRKGRVDKDSIAAAIEETPPEAQDVQYWICGPGAMNRDVKTALMSMDVPDTRIHMESFGGAAAEDDGVTGVNATATVRLDGADHKIDMAADQTLLLALQANGLSVPYSCQSGVCGACRCQVTEGTVHMRNRMALEDADIAKGAALSCQSLATSETLGVNFDR